MREKIDTRTVVVSEYWIQVNSLISILIRSVCCERFVANVARVLSHASGVALKEGSWGDCAALPPKFQGKFKNASVFCDRITRTYNTCNKLITIQYVNTSSVWRLLNKSKMLYYTHEISIHNLWMILAKLSLYAKNYELTLQMQPKKITPLHCVTHYSFGRHQIF